MAEETRTAAYVAWGTLRNALNRLADVGLPNEVNKSVFSGLSGGTQTQLLAAMKFLGLIEEDGTPSATLREAVKKNELERKELLQDVFRNAYSSLFALDLSKATMDELDQALSETYNVTGSTRRKAATFFLKGAEEIGIELSPFLQGPAAAAPRSTSGTKRRRKRTARKVSPKAQASGTEKTVKLASGGGTLTISANLDLFSMNTDDRMFVFDLIEKLEAYEKSVDADASEDEPAAVVMEGGQE